jgi:hypothetical protein
MHRCEVAVGLVGVVVWFVAQTLVAVVVCAVLAIPFAVLFVFDALEDRRRPSSALHLVPPGPPRQPVTAPMSAHRAA